MRRREIDIRRTDNGKPLARSAFETMAADELSRDWVPLAAACATLGRSRTRLLAWLEDNEIPHIKRGGRWYVAKEELFSHLNDL